MTIEFDTFDELKTKLDAMGIYAIKKVSTSVGKLKDCSKCGRKMFAYRVKTEWYYQCKENGEVITHCIGTVECPCGNKVVVYHEDEDEESATMIKEMTRKEAAKRWNEAN